MELHESADGVVVLNDSYNANPASMHAAVDALATIGARRGARTIAVLGEMRELGAESVEGHHGGRRVRGPQGSRRAARHRGTRSHPARRRGESDRIVDHRCVRGGPGQALAWLRENMAPGDVVVVKASRGAELDKLAAVLVEENP